MYWKTVVAAAVVGVGMLLLELITGWTFFFALAKGCAIVMVMVIVWAILAAIWNK